MDLNKYQNEAAVTAIYNTEQQAITYPLLGLIGEVGEFANKYKKVLRDNAEFGRDDMVSELGDILWYLAILARDCDITLSEVGISNIGKLRSRQSRGVLGGSGDGR